MKKLMLMGGFVLALGACKNDFDKAMDKASAITDKMCACKDVACADKVREERSALKKEFKASLGDKKPSDDQMKKMEKLDERWRTCADKLEAPPAPPAPTPGATP